MTLLRPLGLQRRIMLLVMVGLAVIFTVGGFLGLSAIDEASEQVFRERLATAHSTVAVLERDLDRLAADIVLSPHTVQSHRDRIMAKLDLHSKAALVRYAVDRGLVGG